MEPDAMLTRSLSMLTLRVSMAPLPDRVVSAGASTSHPNNTYNPAKYRSTPSRHDANVPKISHAKTLCGTP